ncbi:MAG: Pimeloyl-ACP methyl ester carboxylesterase [Chitinophagaceae bacterium]|nr:Pimeloyl-ACP methyl ester carboxylesterase [Chitinophagaceae bacterium]
MSRGIKYLKWMGVLLILFLLVFLMGPRPPHSFVSSAPVPSELFLQPEQLEKEINKEEKKIIHLKPDNEARIIWADSQHKQKTPYAIVYLHGFSASQAEGYPVHEHIAQRYGCNLFLSRLYAHGLQEEEPLLKMTATQLVASTKEAVAIGRQLGERVILMSTSTGGTLSLLLAGADTSIAALILYSPNIALYDDKAFLLTQPWGLQLARTIVGDRYYRFDAPDAAQQYWNTKYRIEALVQLQQLLQATMKEKTFKAVHQPVFMGYYYKDNKHQDDVVSVPRMLQMYDQLGTPAALKRKVSFPQAGFHVIASSYWTAHTQQVEIETGKFLEEVMHLSKKK